MGSKLLEWRSFILLLLVIGVLAVLVFLPYLNVIVLSAAIAVLFEPVYRKLSYVFPKRTGIASSITVILIFVIVITPLVYFGIQVVHEASDLYGRLALYASSTGGAESGIGALQQHLPQSLARLVPNDPDQVNSVARAGLGWLVNQLGGLFSTLANVFVGFIIMLIAIYYMLKDGRKFVERLAVLSPLAKTHDRVIGEKIYATVNSVVKGTLFVALVQGLLASAGFLIFGVPNAALLGGATVIAALVPAVGTFLTLAPAVVYLFFTGSHLAALGLLLWGLLVVGLIDNFLRPFLIRRDVNIHPFLILLSVLGGLHLFGPIGFITGPLVLSLFMALLDIYTTYVRPDGQGEGLSA